MTTAEWAIVAVGGVLWITLVEISRRLERTNKLLERIHDELDFANKDARDIERRERYPGLPY